MSTAIRLATPEDAAAIVALYAPYVQNTSVTFEYEVPSVAEYRIFYPVSRSAHLVGNAHGEKGYVLHCEHAAALHHAFARHAYAYAAPRHKSFDKLVVDGIHGEIRRQGKHALDVLAAHDKRDARRHSGDASSLRREHDKRSAHAHTQFRHRLFVGDGGNRTRHHSRHQSVKHTKRYDPPFRASLIPVSYTHLTLPTT